MKNLLRRARALIVDYETNRVLLMQRIRDGHKYYTLCGGKLEVNETPEQGCLREIHEETSLHVTLIRELFRAEDIFDDTHNRHFIFLCRYEGGTAQLNGEEIERMTPENQYIPTWVSTYDLNELLIKPDIIGENLRLYMDKHELSQ